MPRATAALSLATGLGVVAVAGCARPEAPPGGPEDRFPPYVVETRPDTFAQVEPGETEFHFRFSERIRERPSQGRLDDAVIVSPASGNVRVEHGRDGIAVKVQRALLPGRVYRVTVLPVIADMFDNPLRDPFDLVVSTGPEFVPNVIGGVVEDRVTGEAAAGVRVDAEFDGGGGEGGAPAVHWNTTGPDGLFSLRYLPAGAARVRAWQDLNRNDTLNASEPRSEYQNARLAAQPDTNLLVLSLVEPDTTPARLAKVAVDDSVTLRFDFDDYLEPYRPGVAVEGTIGREAEGGDTVRLAVLFFHEHEYRRWQAERADSAARAARADTTESGAEGAGREGSAGAAATADPGGPEDAAGQDPVGLSGLLLPSQAMVGVVEEPLERGVPYEASLSGVANLGGVVGGRQTAVFVWEELAQDSAAAPVDSAGAAVVDSAAAAVDTLATDTLAAPAQLDNTLSTDTLPVARSRPPAAEPCAETPRPSPRP